jgi:hypothetical protein
VLSATQISATVPSGATSGTIKVITSCGSVTSSTTFTVTPSSLSVNLHVLIEGYYRGNGTMTGVISQTICDTITLELHQGVSPYSTVAVSRNTINTSGNGTFTFPGNYSGNYYLVVKHRNALETWSASPLQVINNVINFDFTTSQSQAHGNMMKDLSDGRFALYSGDIDHNGNISFSDVINFEAAFISFTTGYVITDLTGDNFTESADYSLLENNVNIHPVTSMP